MHRPESAVGPTAQTTAPVPPPWCKHVVVGVAQADSAFAAGVRAERRALQRRVADAAVHAVKATLPVIVCAMLALAGALAVLMALGCAGHTPVPLLACTAAASLAVWQLPQRRGRSPHWAAGVWAANLAGLWLLLTPGLVCSGLRPTATGLVVAFAIVAATAVSPLPRAAATLALAPLPATLWVAQHHGGWLLVGTFATAGAVLSAATTHRRWRTAVHALIDSLDTQRRFQRERDEAWAKDREKSRFLAIASHDLRQPVHALALFAATLQRRLSQTVDEPLARNMTRAVDGLERSFTALLDISKLDAGALEPRVQTFALRDMFRRLHMQYAGQAEMAGLGLRFSTGGKSVTSDPQLLERMLGNLIHNAIKYTTQGGIVVVARSTRDGLNLEVWDTGAGMAADDLPRIFDEFFQVGSPHRDRSHGLGMGLAIVKRLAALLHHRLEVASAPGRGTRFRIGIAKGSLAGLQEDMAPADTQPLALAASLLVLVVDDDEAIREGLRLLLQEWGYSVVTASDAEQAQQVAQAMEGRIDLILSDLHLGAGADGVDTIAHVRRLCGREVPALLITGDAMPRHIAHARESDVAVLFKPVQARQLLDAMRVALR